MTNQNSPGNYFSSDGYLNLAGRSFIPDVTHEIGYGSLQGHTFRMLFVAGKPITTLPFLDFFEPSPLPENGADVRPLSYLPRVSLHTHALPLETMPAPIPHTKESQPSPLIEWQQFTDFPQFKAMCEQRYKRSFDKRRLKNLDKLTATLGPLRYEFKTRDPKALDACIAWKSAQYRASRLPDLFQSKQLVN